MGKRRSLQFLLVTCLVISSGSLGFAQTKCLGDDDIKRMIAQVKSPRSESLNKDLHEKLLKLKEKSLKGLEQSIGEGKRDEALMQQIRTSRERNTAELCPILKQYG